MAVQEPPGPTGVCPLCSRPLDDHHGWAAFPKFKNEKAQVRCNSTFQSRGVCLTCRKNWTAGGNCNECYAKASGQKFKPRKRADGG